MILVSIYTPRFLTDKNYTHDVLLQLRYYAPVIYTPYYSLIVGLLWSDCGPQKNRKRAERFTGGGGVFPIVHGETPNLRFILK